MNDVCVCNYPNPDPGTDGMCDCDHPLEWHDGYGQCWPATDLDDEVPGHLEPADVPDGGPAVTVPATFKESTDA